MGCSKCAALPAMGACCLHDLYIFGFYTALRGLNRCLNRSKVCPTCMYLVFNLPQELTCCADIWEHRLIRCTLLLVVIINKVKVFKPCWGGACFLVHSISPVRSLEHHPYFEQAIM